MPLKRGPLEGLQEHGSEGRSTATSRRTAQAGGGAHPLEQGTCSFEVSKKRGGQRGASGPQLHEESGQRETKQPRQGGSPAEHVGVVRGRLNAQVNVLVQHRIKVARITLECSLGTPP